jgi:hypothetical protein
VRLRGNRGQRGTSAWNEAELVKPSPIRLLAARCGGGLPMRSTSQDRRFGKQGFLA